MTHTRHPRAHARPMTPKAADDLPLPSPVLIRTSESARWSSAGTSGAWRGASSVMVAFPWGASRDHDDTVVDTAQYLDVDVEVTIEDFFDQHLLGSPISHGTSLGEQEHPLDELGGQGEIVQRAHDRQ